MLHHKTGCVTDLLFAAQIIAAKYVQRNSNFSTLQVGTLQMYYEALTWMERIFPFPRSYVRHLLNTSSDSHSSHSSLIVGRFSPYGTCNLCIVTAWAPKSSYPPNMYNISAWTVILWQCRGGGALPDVGISTQVLLYEEIHKDLFQETHGLLPLTIEN